MGIQHLVDNYYYAGDVLTFFICVTLQVVIFRVLYFSEDLKFRYVKRAVDLIVIACISNVAMYGLCVYKPDQTIAIVIFRDVYHICLMTCLMFFLAYMREMLAIYGKYEKQCIYVAQVFYLVSCILDAISPITSFGLHEHEGVWKDPVVSPFNIFYVFCVILMFLMLAFFSSRIVKAIRYCLVSTQVIVVAIMVYSAIRNINTYSTFTYILPIIAVMILVHSRPLDDHTGALGADSFTQYLERAMETGQSNDYMVLRLDLDLLKSLPVEVAKALNSFWHNDFKEATLFNVESNLFVLAVPRKDKNGNTETKIKRLMTYQFQELYSKYKIDYKIVGFMDIDFITSTEDFMGMLTYILVHMEENSLVLTDASQKEEFKKLKAVRDNLSDIAQKNDLEDPRVLAFCQPIRNVHTRQFDTAESLMRLSLPEVDFVTPNMFIPMAEYYGYIHALSRIMLNKVCKMAKTLEEEGYDFNRISVNFTASEIMKPEFCDEIIEIINLNNLNPNRIGVEITESVNETDFELVKKKVEFLQEAGLTVYLDDIGTGYSNLDRIVKYEVEVVKFDRFFLLESEKDSNVAHMMKHLSLAFRELGYKLLFEGVETEENEELCLSCGADYIQGFKYSKPIPIEEYRGFLSQGEVK